jgi:hypothetical protein
MRDDLLKEQLMSYARTGADEAFQPGAAAIHRRARRHYRRVAALTVTGVVLAVGLGAGIGLRRDGGAPTVGQPTPTLTGPGPTVPSTATTSPATSTTVAPRELLGTFTSDLGGRVVVLSTRTGELVRTLFGPHALGTQAYAVGMSPDRATVYFSNEGGDPCQSPGVFRVGAGGGRAVTVVAGENAAGAIKVAADGSRLAYLGAPCPSTGQLDVVVRDAGGALVGRWLAGSAGAGVTADGVSLSPDGRLLAIPISRNLTFLGVRVLDVARDRSIADGRLLKAPDPGCALVQTEFHPRNGRLAAFERCPPRDPQGTVPRFRLVYLDPASGRLLSRSFAFDDHSGADLHVATMDFDQSGRHLLYAVSSADPMDSQEPRPETGTWRFSGGRPVRVQDDRRLGDGQRITSRDPAW